MSRLRDFFLRERRLAAQQGELARMGRELGKLRDQNERMRDGMRRCLTCDYRREVIGQRANAEQGDELDPGPNS